jgi:hypothetical protein
VPFVKLVPTTFNPSLVLLLTAAGVIFVEFAVRLESNATVPPATVHVNGVTAPVVVFVLWPVTNPPSADMASAVVESSVLSGEIM